MPENKTNKDGQVIFLSHVLNEQTPAYGGASGPSFKSQSSIEAGDSANVTSFCTTTHIGTHIDVPKHFFDHGMALTDYAASDWVFNAPVIVDVPYSDGYLVSPSDVEGAINNETDMLIIRTGSEKYRSEDRFWNSNPGLSSELGFWLRNNYPKIRCVGLDCISVTSRLHREEGGKAHRAFLDPDGLAEPLILIEDMKLASCEHVLKQVVVGPLMLDGADGGPCVVIGFI